MTASELIDELREKIDKVGDFPVVIVRQEGFGNRANEVSEVGVDFHKIRKEAVIVIDDE